MNKAAYDYLLVGAGLHNAVFAYEARRHGKRCLVIDKRPHLGGNIYCEDVQGITVHKYGPHIFHTSDKEVWDYVNSLVPFHQYQLNTIASYQGQLFNLPFNMNTFHQMWGVVTPEEAQAKLEEQKLTIESPRNLEEQARSLVGDDVYETLIKGYTEKQWGRPCAELPSVIIRRLPVRFTYNNNYFNDPYQGIPDGGYNKLIDKLLEDVECRTDCNYFDDKSYFNRIADSIIYSGPIDEFYNYQLGHLEYRSLRFEEETLNTRNYQGNAIVNYTDVNTPYTRIVEHKHFDMFNPVATNSSHTVITREYPLPFSEETNAEPYYPVNDDWNNELARKYGEMARELPNVTFAGRLGLYRYLDMDEVIVEAKKNILLL